MDLLERIFYILAVILCFPLAVIWSTKGLLNLFVKLYLIVLTIFGILLILNSYGFIMKV